MEVLFFASVAIVVLVVGLVVAVQQQKAWEEALREVAEERGLRYRDANKKMVLGEIDDVSVVIDSYTTGSGKSKSTWTRWRLHDAQAPKGEIGAEGMFSMLGKAISGGDLTLGDPAFDDQVLLHGPELELRSRLNASARSQLRVAVGEGWSLSDGEWTYRTSGRETSLAALSGYIDDGLALCHALRPQGHVDDRLLAVIEHDPVMSVRIRTLQACLDDGRLSTGMRAGIADRNDDVVGLLAARALGDAERLEQRLAHTELAVRVQAAVSLAELVRRGTELACLDQVEARLLEGLHTEPWIDRCIQHLGSVGSVGAVESLQKHSTVLLPSPRKRLAVDAIRTIQARQVGAAAGQISLVEVDGGALSVAEAPEQGQLSQPRPPRQTE